MNLELEDHLNKLIYWEGYKQALYDFAIHQNGTLVVGCGIYTYKRALEMKYKELFGREYHEVQNIT